MPRSCLIRQLPVPPHLRIWWHQNPMPLTRYCLKRGATRQAPALVIWKANDTPPVRQVVEIAHWFPSVRGNTRLRVYVQFTGCERTARGAPILRQNRADAATSCAWYGVGMWKRAKRAAVANVTTKAPAAALGWGAQHGVVWEEQRARRGAHFVLRDRNSASTCAAHVSATVQRGARAPCCRRNGRAMQPCIWHRRSGRTQQQRLPPRRATRTACQLAAAGVLRDHIVVVFARDGAVPVAAVAVVRWADGGR